MGGNKKVITVSLPADLLEVIEDMGGWYNRSALVGEALEAFIMRKNPTMYKILMMRREARKDG